MVFGNSDGQGTVASAFSGIEGVDIWSNPWLYFTDQGQKAPEEDQITD